MRPARLVFRRLVFTGSVLVGGIAAPFALASPALVSPAVPKNSSPNSHADANAQSTEEQPDAHGCRAYQQAPDGSWIQLACREGGGAAAAPAHGKPAQTR
jgi:hypothetical protein